MNIFGMQVSPELLFAFCAGLIAVLLLVAVAAFFLALHLNKRLKMLMRDDNGKNISGAVLAYYQKCSTLAEQFSKAEERIIKLENEMKTCAKKIGTVRYNAFDEGGSNLSFVAAVLDDSDSGFVLNGIYARGDTTTYLKPIANGKSIFELSEEEKEAISRAKDNYNEKIQKKGAFIHD